MPYAVFCNNHDSYISTRILVVGPLRYIVALGSLLNNRPAMVKNTAFEIKWYPFLRWSFIEQIGMQLILLYEQSLDGNDITYMQRQDIFPRIGRLMILFF